MSALEFPAMAVFIVASFFTLVALGQAVLFGGRHARWASLMVGAAFYVSAVVIESLLSDRLAPASSAPVLMFCAIAGAFCGYVGGAIIGGTFMIAEFVRKIMTPKAS